jgi:hypothetical protein
MMKSRIAKAATVASVLLVAAMAPAMAAGGPAGAGAGGEMGGQGLHATASADGGHGVDAAQPTDAGGGPPADTGGGPPADMGGGGSGGGGGGGKPDDPGGGGGKPGGETAGNNLSFPVQWSETGRTVTLPGVMDVVTIQGTVLPGTYTPDDLTPCLGAVQKDPLNSWQADSVLATPNSVTTIDWGDNLESKDWKLGTVVRVETGLYDSVLDAAMTRYEMCYISGSGTDEVWGLRVTGSAGNYVPVSFESTEAMVYTAGARLTIQKIDAATAGSLTWDAATHQWTGTGATAPVFNMATWERTSDGPGSYGAELNVGGKIVYGFVWRTSGLEEGEYRLTFSLDNDAEFDSGATLVGAGILQAVEEEVTVSAEDEGAGNTAVVDDTNDLTYIDVGLVGGGGSAR